MVAENFFAAPQVRQWLDGVEPTWTLLTFTVCGSCSGDATICCFAANSSTDKDGRLPDDADLVVRALALLEGFAAYPVGALPHRRTSAGCEVLRLKSPPRQLPCAPRATGDTGRASGPTGQGQATAEAVQRVASGMPPEHTGPAAPARRRPRAAACRAIGRSPTKSDLVGCSFKCSPSATTPDVRSP